MVLVCFGIDLESSQESFMEYIVEYFLKSAPQSVLKSALLEKKIMEFALDPPLEGGADENYGRP